MVGIANQFAQIVPQPRVSLGQMGTKDVLRARAQRLLDQGVTQKKIAAKMGVARAAFNRWIHGEDARISVDALDAFNAFVRELRAALGEEAPHEEPSATNSTPPGRTRSGESPRADKKRRQSGR